MGDFSRLPSHYKPLKNLFCDIEQAKRIYWEAITQIFAPDIFRIISSYSCSRFYSNRFAEECTAHLSKAYYLQERPTSYRLAVVPSFQLFLNRSTKSMKNYVILDCSLLKPHNIYSHNGACPTNGGSVIQDKQMGTIQSLSSLTLWATWPTDYPLRCLFITSFISYHYSLFMAFGFVKEILCQTPFLESFVSH